MSDPVDNFVSAFADSLANDSFVKVTLSNYKGAEWHLQKVAGRVIETRAGRRLALQFHYETRQTVKNYGFEDAVVAVRDLLGSGFRSAHLFTTAGDVQLTIGKRNSHLKRSKATLTEKPSTRHDRPKNYLLDPSAFYLNALGITTDDGRVRAQQQDKWRQINKYVEILRDLYEASSLAGRDELKIIDMGSGKGYLTFAAYDYFNNVRSIRVKMTGVEIREDLVVLCNQVSGAAGFDGLAFTKGEIDSFHLDHTDILIALHACDTATDDALYKGIAAGAEIIVAAPCCHKEVRQQMKPTDALKGILRHGTLLERTAETLTDGIRAMLLEEHGYRTKVFEFVSPEHTPKNNMISATRDPKMRAGYSEIRKQINDVFESFGIRSQRLDTLLKTERPRDLLAARQKNSPS